MSYIYLNLLAESEEILMGVLATAGLSEHVDLVVLGTLYKPTVDPEIPSSAPIHGFHANIALTDPAFIPLLETITVHPKTPIVGWFL